MTKRISRETILVVLMASLGVLSILVIPMPYSLLPLATWLAVGGLVIWERGKATWLRGLGISAFAGGIILTLVILVLSYMIFNARLVHEVVPLITPVSTPANIVLDNRAPAQKTRIPFGNLRCTPNPVGLTLTAKIEPRADPSVPLVSQTIQIVGIGFVPNETLHIFLKEYRADTTRILGFNQSVNNDGTFSRDELVSWDAPQTEWQVWVVHQRGVACVQFKGN